MDRLVAAGNSGIKGVLDKGSAVATDPTTVTMNLVSANGNFPYLVSVFNAQSLITPATYVAGHDPRQARRTGPVPGSSSKAATTSPRASSSSATTPGGAARPRSTAPSSSSSMTPASMVTAYQGGQIDALVQFDVLSGAPLFTDPNFTVVDTPTTNHRQIWMRTDTGTFADTKVRQAFALSIDRPALIQQLFKGKGVPANDHVDLAVLPVLQRHGDPAGAGHREGQAAPVRRRRRPPSVPPSSTDG